MRSNHVCDEYNKKSKENDEDHDDHIFPLSLGGSNEKINHQILTSTENLKKSNDIYFESVQTINPQLLSERYRKALTEATNINELMDKYIGEIRNRTYIFNRNELIAKEIDKIKLHDIKELYHQITKKITIIKID